MYIVVGLGNPEKKYFGTRHNAGFHAIDYISQQYNINVTKLKCKSLIGDGKIDGERVILVEPQTYMNLSGEAILELVKWYKVEKSDIIIVYDDIALPLGKIRVREKGSDGGHNGIKSVIYSLKTDEFPRIKIGIGSPENSDYEIIDYVLGKFAKDEQKIVFEAIKTVSDIVTDIVKNGVPFTMNRYNGI